MYTTHMVALTVCFYTHTKPAPNKYESIAMASQFILQGDQPPAIILMNIWFKKRMSNHTVCIIQYDSKNQIVIPILPCQYHGAQSDLWLRHMFRWKDLKNTYPSLKAVCLLLLSNPRGV